MRSTIVIALVLLGLYGTGETLRWGDEGVCKRRRDFSDRRTRLECCNYWKFDFKAKKCVFYCHLDCGAGKCIGPNRCSCDPPNIFVDDKCVEPTCEPGCVNATCVGQDICSCNAGYEKLNATHCAPPCPTGYERSCENGTCTDSAECMPICEHDCVNATCVGQNTCSCISGYEKLNATHCDPPCPAGYERSCENGTCTDSAECMPICEPACVNATCVGQNTCSCISGYEKLNATHCAPPCPTGYERRCENGTCTDSVECVPVCEPDCVNAVCVEPNTCSCMSGYDVLNSTHCAPPCPTGYKRSCRDEKCSNSVSCIPICEPSCVNGVCIEPGICQCHEGFTNVSNWQCDPICNDCQDGTCLAPNNCICNEGYLIKDGKCLPHCDSCTNGDCTAPGKCTCHPGFIADRESPSICYKQCGGPCGNGTCIKGTCDCDSGYKLINDTCVSPLPVLCKDCNGSCTEDSGCFCSDDRPCLNPLIAESAEVASSTRLAGLELTWLVGGVIGLIIITLLIVIISYMWRKRQEYGAKSTVEQGNTYSGSVVYTVSNTLLHNRDDERQEVLYDVPNEKDKAASEALLEERPAREGNMYD